MSKDLITANIFSAGALATVLANLETGITLLVLITALVINLRKLLKDTKGTDNPQ